MQDFGDVDFHVFADVFLAVLDHDHCAVVHVADTLSVFLTFLNDVDAQAFTGQYNRFDCVGEFVDVEHGHALKFGDAVEVVIVGQYRTFELLALYDQFIVHLTHAFDVDV